MKPEKRNHYYDGWFYKRFIDPFLHRVRRHVVDWIPNGSRVIDIGSGTGDQLFQLAPLLAEGVGVELSETMVRFASEEAESRGLGQISFHLGDASDLPQFQPAEFDYAVCAMVLHEMPATLRLPVLEEMKRLAPEVIIADYARTDDSWKQRLSIYTIEFLAGWQHFRGFLSYRAAGGMPHLLKQAGLRILETRRAVRGSVRLWRCSPGSA